MNINLYERNCAVFVQDVLTAGGIKCPGNIQPRKLMDDYWEVNVNKS